MNSAVALIYSAIDLIDHPRRINVMWCFRNQLSHSRVLVRTKATSHLHCLRVNLQESRAVARKPRDVACYLLHSYSTWSLGMMLLEIIAEIL